MTDAMIAIGIDPGPKLTAWSELHMVNGTLHWVDGKRAPWPDVVQRVLEVRPNVVCIEKVDENPYNPRAHLISTAKVEIHILEQLCAKGLDPWHLLATQIRSEFVGCRNPSDKAIRLAVEGFIKSVPKLTCKERPHVYDAAAAAAVGIAMTAGRTIVFDDMLRTAVDAQIEADKRKRVAKAAKTRAEKKARAA